jgi:hypothetical protein
MTPTPRSDSSRAAPCRVLGYSNPCYRQRARDAWSRECQVQRDQNLTPFGVRRRRAIHDPMAIAISIPVRDAFSRMACRGIGDPAARIYRSLSVFACSCSGAASLQPDGRTRRRGAAAAPDPSLASRRGPTSGGPDQRSSPLTAASARFQHHTPSREGSITAGTAQRVKPIHPHRVTNAAIPVGA